MFTKIKTLDLLVTLMLSFTLASGVASSTSLKQELLKAADKKARGQYVRESFLKRLNKPFVDNGQKKLLLVGDSHAQDFMNAMVENNSLSDYQISTYYISSRCQMFLDDGQKENILSKDKSYCERESGSLKKASSILQQADVIILSSNWKEWGAKILAKTIDDLNLSENQQLFVIGRKSFGTVSIRKLLRLPEDKLISLRNPTDNVQQKINDILKSTISPSMFIDHQLLVCGSGGDCPLFTPETKLITFDGGHLTRDGAKYVGNILFEKSVLANL